MSCSPLLRCRGGHPAHTSSSIAGALRALSVGGGWAVEVPSEGRRPTTRQASALCAGNELVEVELTLGFVGIVFDAASAADCTFWDTADAYADSEELIGKWFKRTGKRDQIFISAKFEFMADFTIDGSPTMSNARQSFPSRNSRTDHKVPIEGRKNQAPPWLFGLRPKPEHHYSLPTQIAQSLTTNAPTLQCANGILPISSIMQPDYRLLISFRVSAAERRSISYQTCSYVSALNGPGDADFDAMAFPMVTWLVATYLHNNMEMCIFDESGRVLAVFSALRKAPYLNCAFMQIYAHSFLARMYIPEESHLRSLEQ
ncbi:hypothetical protein C8J57DRAFT_1636770 [Mycena rebaudengoi]|nr:hypothetical protein C8J57DRAFT_1636770 [Mycena rebaudengoi]